MSTNVVRFTQREPITPANQLGYVVQLHSKHYASAKNLAHASYIVRLYIDTLGLGSSDFEGGMVWFDGRPVARVSYNGRLWTPEPWPNCTEIEL